MEESTVFVSAGQTVEGNTHGAHTHKVIFKSGKAIITLVFELSHVEAFIL